MPELWVRFRWPDGRAATCYSPSTVVRDYFVPGATYQVAEFVALTRTALTFASERVRLKFGMPCSRARSEIARIEDEAARQGDGLVTVDSLETAPLPKGHVR